MNILAVNASPKGEKSNTWQLTCAFLEGIRSALPNVTIEKIELRTADVRPCLGCFSCWNKTPGKCCIQDDMAAFLEKRRNADLVIWSFPLYYFNVPGPLKNFIDRQLPMVLPFMTDRTDGTGNGSHPARYDLSAQKHVLISTCGFYTARGNYDSVLSMFDHMCGKNNYTTIFCGQGELFRVPELKQRTAAYLEAVLQAGKEYVSGGITPTTFRQLEQLLFPKEVFEAMADASWGISKDSGQKEEESLIFTRQMAALYNKSAWAGKDLVLEMHYTDLNHRYQILLTKDGSRVLTDCTPQKLKRPSASGAISHPAGFPDNRHFLSSATGYRAILA